MAKEDPDGRPEEDSGTESADPSPEAPEPVGKE